MTTPVAFVRRISPLLLACGIWQTPRDAGAVTYTYGNVTSNSAPGSGWASGAGWAPSAPAGSPSTSLLFTGNPGAGATIYTSNDLPGNFLLNALAFTVAAPANDSAPAYNVNGNPLEFTAQGGAAPTLTLAATGMAAPVFTCNNDFALDDALTLAATSAGTFAGAIRGSGGLTKTGAGAVSFTGVNLYTGPTVISAGQWTVNGVSGSISASSRIAINGGALRVDNVAGVADRLGDNASVTVSQNGQLSVGFNSSADVTETVAQFAIDSGNSIVTISSASDRVTSLAASRFARANYATALFRGPAFNQSAAANVARFTLANPAGLPLAGTNSLDAAPGDDATQGLKIVPFLFGDINVNGLGSNFVTYDATLGFRVLTAREGQAIAASETTNASAPRNATVSTSVTVPSAADLLENSLLFTGGGTLNGSGKSLTLHSGALATTPAAAANAIGAGFSSLIFGNGEGVITTMANTLTISTPIEVPGNGGITKAGAGALWLKAANRYTGATTVNAGVVEAGNNLACGTGPVTLANAGTPVRLLVDGGITLGNEVNLGANLGAASFGLVHVASGTGVLQGAVNITGAVANGGHFATAGAAILNVNGPIAASVPVVVRNGNVNFGGGGAGYAGLTAFGGVVGVSAENGIAALAVVTLGGDGAPANLDLAGFNQSLAGLMGGASPGSTVGNSSTATDSTLTLSGGSSFAGTISNTLGSGTRKLNLVVAGGSVSLAGANTFTGTTAIGGGALQVSGSISGSASVAVINGGTLLLAGGGAGSPGRLGDSAPVTLGNAGAVGVPRLQLDSAATAPITEKAGALTLASDSIIDFGTASTGGVLRFDDSSVRVWTGTLSIYNWTNDSKGNGVDHVYVGTNKAGLTSKQLGEIWFYADDGATFLGTGAFGAAGDGELVTAVPEPATVFGGFLLSMLAGRQALRRRRQAASCSGGAKRL